MASRARAERGWTAPGRAELGRLGLIWAESRLPLRRGKRGAARAGPVPTRYKEDRANI